MNQNGQKPTSPVNDVTHKTPKTNDFSLIFIANSKTSEGLNSSLRQLTKELCCC